MRSFKQKTLTAIGIPLTITTICLLSYFAWKMLFYFESENYGKKLTKDLLSKTPDSIVKPFGSDYPFQYFDHYRQPLKENNLYDNNLVCEAMTDIRSLYSFSANVRCFFSNKIFHFYFTKNYDHPWHLVFVAFLSTLSIAGVLKFFFYIEELQELGILKTLELEREHIIVEVGAKLVHDLKKGIMTRINTLSQKYGDDFDDEVIQPDFLDKLKNNLQIHFKHIEFLNKYMSLLTANLKRNKESNWILLDQNKLQEFLFMIFPVKNNMETIESNQTCFVYNTTQSNKIYFEKNKNFSPFWVPEMSFFRILKNISENFNAYGKETLRIELNSLEAEKKVILSAKNRINQNAKQDSSSTQIGLTIIKQLLVDNFGPNSQVQINKEQENFCLTLSFSRIKKLS